MVNARRSPFLAVLFSLGLVIAGGKGLVDSHRQSKWVATEAKTTFATPAGNRSFLDFLEGFDARSKARRTHGVKVDYAYQAAGKEYRGEYLFGKFTRDDAAIEAGAFPTGDTITVYLDPAHPDRSTKDRARAGLSLLLAILGLAGLMASPFLP